MLSYYFAKVDPRTAMLRANRPAWNFRPEPNFVNIDKIGAIPYSAGMISEEVLHCRSCCLQSIHGVWNVCYPNYILFSLTLQLTYGTGK